MKEVLIIIPYTHIYPAMNGGMQRCINILHQLARFFKVTAIINQDAKSFAEAINEYPALKRVDLYSTTNDKQGKPVKNPKLVRIITAIRYRLLKRSLLATTDSNFMLYHPVLKTLFMKKKFDIVVLENLDSLNAVSIIRKHDKNLCIIYDAHNVDTVLAKAAFHKSETTADMMDRIRMAEENIYKKVDAVIACSQNDLEMLQKMNQGNLKGVVVPNGVNADLVKFDKEVHDDNCRTLLFCGTLWSAANIEGLEWFYNHVWPSLTAEFEAIELIVLGSGEPPSRLSNMKADRKVTFTGSVQDVKPWYNKAVVALVPLLTGSGTRLKVLEAMGMGVPVVSTALGAEGINYTNHKDIVIADLPLNFASEISGLLKDTNKRLELAQHASKLVGDQYDWNIIGKNMAEFIENAS